MTQEKQEAKVVISNPQGLHARPADLFVRTALRFQSKIGVIKNGARVDGKSMLSVLTLVAPLGTELTIETEGPDSQEALAALVELVQKKFHEA